MPKNTFSDIVPPPNRSIRNIQRSHAGRQRPNIPHPVEERNTVPPVPNGRMPYVVNKFFNRYGIWLIALVFLIMLIVAVSFIFSGSKVVVTPQQKDVSVDGQFVALREPTGGQLAYDVVEIERTAGKTVASTGTEHVEERSSGQITIFNDFSTKEQRLVTNTRFETSSGLIYRIHEPVVIPGQKKSTDGSAVPGSVTVTVYSDEPGEKYNIGLVDFTIPGFKGTQQYDDFYARSRSDMAGGFSGERTVVDKTTLEITTNELKGLLEKQLTDELRKNKPNDFELFDGALFFTLGNPKIIEESKGEARVELTSKAYATIFKSVDLARYIAGETVGDYDNEPVQLESVEDIKFSIPPESTFDPTTNEDLTFNLKGSTHIIWLFDAEKLAKDLSGRSKEALPTILSGYPGIDTAEVILRPFWKQTFPDDPQKISIRTDLGSNQ
ncbi:MAG TPA: hypothetical protein VJH21_00965 [Candidatus Paceibacterota bacterium]